MEKIDINGVQHIEIDKALEEIFNVPKLSDTLKTQKTRWKNGLLGITAKINIIEKHGKYSCVTFCRIAEDLI